MIFYPYNLLRKLHWGFIIQTVLQAKQHRGMGNDNIALHTRILYGFVYRKTSIITVQAIN